MSFVFEPISKSGIHKMVNRFIREINVGVDRKERTQIAVDETVVKIQGHLCFVWAAVDIHTKELIAVDVSAGRSELDCRFFLAKIKSKCVGKLPIIITDRGPWYNCVQDTGFDHWYNTFSIRNSVERFFRYLKERTRVFCNNINGTFRCLTIFVKLFSFLYRMLRGG